jgi:sugar O-acyltransferase (sialic acid O-acetyltransferase NeuD family)
MAASDVRIVIYGAGGQARELIDLVSDLPSSIRVVALVDRNAEPGKHVMGVPVVSSARELGVEASDVRAVIGSGLIPLRDRMLEEIEEAGIEAVALVHPSVTVASSARICGGAIIAAQSAVMNDVLVGEHCLVNVCCSIGHDCRIGRAAVLSPGVRLGGAVNVGEAAFLGLGAIVLPGVTIGERAVVGAGSVVNRDVPAGLTVAGIPARAVG